MKICSSILKKIPLFFIPGLFVSCSTLVYQNAEMEKEIVKVEINQESTIICFGDSLTYGNGSDTKTESWPALLQKRIKIPVINAGVNDDTTEDGKNRFEKDVLEKNPVMIIFDFGGNDLYNSKPRLTYSQIEENYRQMLDQLDLEKTQVYIMRFFNDEMRFFDPFCKFDKILRHLENDYNIIVIWDAWKDAWGHKDCKYDMTHCNAKGYSIMEQNIYKVIKPFLEQNDLLVNGE